jgi:trimeric autotransporter adhesin
MALSQPGWARWLSGRLVSLTLWIGLLAGCSGSDSPAFSSVSSSDGGGSGDSGGEAASFPQVNDTVFSLVSDGAGGVYLGGRFSLVGEVPRQALAHVLANGTVDPSWNPLPDGPVTALLLHDQTLYVGGNFFGLSGEERWRLAAVDRTTGLLMPWDPKLGTANLVNALASSNGVVYVGGVFELVNAVVIPGTGLRGEGRRNLAAVDATTGIATPWNPNVFDGEVMALGVADSLVYAGGSFDQVGFVGQDTIRLNLAAFDAGSGVAMPWNPSVRGINGDIVQALLVADDLIYIGGRFTEVGGQARDNLAAVDRAAGLATGFNMPTNDTVFTLFDDGRRLYVGGLFTTIAGQPRGRLAAIDKTTGLLTSWNPNANGLVRSIVVSGGKVFVGGEFTTIGGQPHTMFAVIDPETGQLVGD